MADNINIRLGLTGLAAVENGFQRISDQLSGTKRSFDQFNRATSASVGLITSFSSVAGQFGNQTLKELAANADRAALAMASLKNTAQLLTSVRVGAWSAAAGTAIVAMGEALSLIETMQKEREAKEGLAAMNVRLADSIMDIVAAQQASGQLSEEQAQKALEAAFLAKSVGGGNDTIPAETIQAELIPQARILFDNQSSAADEAKAAELMKQLRRAQIVAGRSVNVSGELAEFDAVERANAFEKEISSLKLNEETKKKLLLENRRLLGFEESKINRETLEQIAADEEKAARKKKQIQQDFLSSSADIMGSMANLAKLFGKKGFLAWKAFALAQATISGANAVLLQLGQGEAYSAPFRAIAAGIAAGVQIATIAATQPSGFMLGGYTGDGPRTGVAGPVHFGEFVVPAPAVRRLGVENLEAMTAGAAPVSVGGSKITNAILFTESAARDLIRSKAGTSEILNIIRLNKVSLGLAT